MMRGDDLVDEFMRRISFVVTTPTMRLEFITNDLLSPTQYFITRV